VGPSTPLNPTHRRVAIVGADGKIAGAFSRSPADLFDEVGLNTGNLAFWLAFSRHIRADHVEYFSWDFDPDRVRSEFDCLVFVAANQLFEGWDLGGLADRFDRCDLPMVVVGLGAQSTEGVSKIDLRPGTRRLLRVFSERCKQIGMRGEFSAQVAMDNGARNVVVTGCPSHFINTEIALLGRHVEHRLREFSRPNRLALCLDFHEDLADVDRRCVAWMLRYGGAIFAQSPLSAVSLGLGAGEELSPDEWTAYARVLLDAEDSEASRRLLLNHFVTFFDAEAWLCALRGSGLSLGTRIHGNILALQSGVPALFIPHDSRSRELAMTIGAPIVERQQVVAAESLPRLVSEVSFSGRDFDLRRRDLADAYLGLLRASGLAPADDLVALAHAMNTAVDAGPAQPGPATIAARRTGDSATAAAMKETTMPVVSDFAVQRDGTTKDDRYPEVFAAVRRLWEARGGGAVKILSFGCSTGEEPLCLARDYFSQGVVVGLDVSESALEAARMQHSWQGRIVYDLSTPQTLTDYGPFDIIFAMSVLCRWPTLEGKEDAFEIFPFEKFDEMVSVLDAHLKPGGLLVVYNSSYHFTDATAARRYQTVLSPSIESNGYVGKFDRDSRALPGDGGNDVIYIKLESGAPSNAPGIMQIVNEAGHYLGRVRHRR
jgi:predicted O-methyltransferase YrrM